MLVALILAATLVEPTTLATGGPLTHLKSCQYTVSQTGQTPGSVTVPASSPSGGGSHLLVSNFEGAVNISADCVREVGGVESPRSSKATLDTTFPVAPPAAPELLP